MFVDNYVANPTIKGDRLLPEDRGGNFFDTAVQNSRANQLRHENFKLVRRPFLDAQGYPCVLFNTGQKWTTEKGERVDLPRPYRIGDLLNSRYGRHVPLWTFNATTMRKEDWIELDRRIVLAATKPLVVWDLISSRGKMSGFNAYARSTIEYEAMSEAHEAVVDMDLLTPGRNDNPLFTLRSIPLPITHSDFWYSDRRLEISGNNGDPLSTLSAAEAAKRVGEMVEDTVLGEVTGVTYGTVAAGNYAAHEGTSTVYGFQNFTYRNTKTDLTTPDGTNPHSVFQDVLEMIQTLKDEDYYGPYTLLFSQAYSQYMNSPYAYTNGSGWAVAPTQTLRQAIEGIGDISDAIEVPRLGGAAEYVMILFDNGANVVEAIDGQPITTLQWETVGGLKKNFKVWCIQVPFFKAEYNQNSGLIVGTTA